MSGLEGYTGPTSGRIRVGGDGAVERETFTDPPLTREEEEAVAWFTALSPNGQLREVRRLKWNLAEAERARDAVLERVLRAEGENARLEAERDARRPDGYELPRAAAELRRVALEHGWLTAAGWYLDEDGQGARFTLQLGTRDKAHLYRYSWAVLRDGRGAGRLLRAGLARTPGRTWYTAPALKTLESIIRDLPQGTAN